MRYKVLCGYIRQRWDCGDTVEIEEKHTGKYGAKRHRRERKEEKPLQKRLRSITSGNANAMFED